MRRLLIIPAVAGLLAASPALAQERGRPHRAPDLDQAAALLSNPVAQDAATALIAQFADALLDTHVGPLALLTDPRDDVRPGDTVGDVVRRDDPAFDARLRANTRRSLAVTGQALRGAAVMDRELRATAARLRAVMAEVNRGAGAY